MAFAVRLVQDKLVNTHEIFALLHTSAEEARHCSGVWSLSKCSYLLQEGKSCGQPDTLEMKHIILIADPYGALH